MRATGSSPKVADALARDPEPRSKRANTYATDESAVRVYLKPALRGPIGTYTKANMQRLVDTGEN